MIATAAPSHVRLDEHSVAWIDRTGLRVLDLAREHLAHGWDAEMLADNHPPLTLAQAHSALAWFYDHQQEVEAEMSRRDAAARSIIAETGGGTLQKRLQNLKAVSGA